MLSPQSWANPRRLPYTTAILVKPTSTPPRSEKWGPTLPPDMSLTINWQPFFQEQTKPPDEEASSKDKMAYKLQTEIGKAIYRLRKCTVEPMIGIIKEILGFRQFSLRGLWAIAGE